MNTLMKITQKAMIVGSIACKNVCTNQTVRTKNVFTSKTSHYNTEEYS